MCACAWDPNYVDATTDERARLACALGAAVAAAELLRPRMAGGLPSSASSSTGETPGDAPSAST